MAKVNKIFRKTTPYRFPNKKHIRTESPPEYRQYSSYKGALVREFNAQCVYCRSPLSFGSRGVSAVEHYRPKKHFPKLKTKYANLFLSCMRCNAFKGSYWSDSQQRRILNPCDDIMSHHLSFSDVEVRSNTERGTTHTNLLKLNDSERLTDRNTINTAIRLAIDRLLRYKDIKHPEFQVTSNASDVLDMLSTFTGVSVEKLEKLLA